MELKDLITGAQEAMDQGDYRLAIAASEHALAGYSACLAAHRVLGEAYLERGDQKAATDHFERTLSIDPLNVVARLGLGVAAEEAKRYEDAYAHYLHAWEINPALDQVRDELVRLRGLLNVDDRLHPTRAGLAGIHSRCGQFSRAAAEWRAVLSVEPESRRARTSLAELLWRQGDDNGAIASAREALRGCPENARALAILADAEKRRGGPNADEFAQRFSSVDPTGEVLDYLQHWRSDTDLQSLLPESILINEFDFESNRSRHTSGLGRKAITGSLSAAQMAAPDLWDTLVKDLTTDVPAKMSPTLASAVEPMSWADGPPRDDAMSRSGTPVAPVAIDDADLFPELATATDADQALAADPVAADEIASPEQLDGSEIDDAVAEVEGLGDLMPFAPEEVAFDLPADGSDEHEAKSAAGAMDEDIDLDIVPFSMDQLTGTVTPGSPDLDEAALTASFGDSIAPDLPEPVAEVAATPSHEPYVDPFVDEEGRIDLTAGWDRLDQELEAATPPADGDAGFDALVAEIDVDGIVPFDAATESPDEDAWSPFSEVDFDVPIAAEEPVADLEQPGIELPLPDATGEALDIAELEAFDVNAFIEPDAEPIAEPAPSLGKDIVTGIPLPEPSGYTALLANVDDESLLDLAAHAHEVIDPFANPDASGAPLAFDELIEVTSSDGTGPLAESEQPTAAAELDLRNADLASATPSELPDAPDADLDGLEPFDSSAFGESAMESEDASTLAGAEATMTVAPEPVHLVGDLPMAAELGDVAPFVFEDGATSDGDGASVDFTDMDGVFEPPVMIEVAPSESFAADEAQVAAALFEAAGMVPADDAQVEPEAGLAFDEEPLDVQSEAEADDSGLVAVPIAAQNEPNNETPPERSVPAGGSKVLWPQFMAQTSELFDRPREGGSLFSRIAAQKDALVEMGVVTGRRRLSAPKPDHSEAAVAVAERPAAVAENRAQEDMDEEIRAELMRMRVRLIEDESSAEGIAEALEAAIAEGLQAPLALRVLGEAYLKLGQVERAAAQFRQAMRTRRRGA